MAALCMSSNGFGQIVPKAKRWFRDSSIPFLQFQQVSKNIFASFVKHSFQLNDFYYLLAKG
jgi:hypothetical protein